MLNTSKNLLGVFLSALLVLLCSVPAWAQDDGEEEEETEFDIENSILEICEEHAYLAMEDLLEEKDCEDINPEKVGTASGGKCAKALKGAAKLFRQKVPRSDIMQAARDSAQEVYDLYCSDDDDDDGEEENPGEELPGENPGGENPGEGNGEGPGEGGGGNGGPGFGGPGEGGPGERGPGPR